MAISLNSTSSATAGAPGSSALTFAHTVNSGDDRCLLVFVECPNSGDLLASATVTYGGVSLGAAVLNTPANSGALRTYVWRMVAPLVGSANVVITPSAAAYMNARAVTFNGVDQSAPIANSNAASREFATSPQSLAIISGAQGVAVGSCSLRNNTSAITAIDGSEAIGAVLTNSVSQMLLSYKAASTSLNFSFTGSQPLALLSAVALNAAVAASPVSFTGTVPNQQAVVDTPFSFDLAPYTAGSLTPFTYSIFSGSLPDGLSLSGSVIGGTPTAVDTVNLVVRATDTGSNVANTNEFTIEVNLALQPPQGTVTLGPATGVTSTGASIAYSYSASDQTGFEYRLNGGAAQTASANPLVLTGLTASTSYTVEMRAVNAAGSGAWSSPINFTTSAAPQVPQGTFTIGTITAGQTTASVPYTYSASDQTLIQYRINGGTTQTATASPQALSGLTANTAYTIEFRAVNATGNGAWSTPANFNTQPVPAMVGITLSDLTNNAGQPWASQAGIICDVYNQSTGALVVRKTGLSTTAGADLSFTDGALVSGTEYTMVISIGTARGVVSVVAA